VSRRPAQPGSSSTFQRDEVHDLDRPRVGLDQLVARVHVALAAELTVNQERFVVNDADAQRGSEPIPRAAWRPRGRFRRG